MRREETEILEALAGRRPDWVDQFQQELPAARQTACQRLDQAMRLEDLGQSQALQPMHPEQMLEGLTGYSSEGLQRLAAELRQSVANLALAGALAGQGRHEEASAETRVSLAILEATLGADHPTVAATRNDLATTLLALGHPPQAERELRAALATFERTLPDEHPNLVIVRTNLGDALAAQGDLDGARAVLERAVAVAERIEGSVQARADARRALAKVLRRSPDGQRRARELAERAREDYRTLPPDALDGQLEELDAWLGP